ncbi:DUF1642 domain-containing protein [Streptococcus suis]|uniref:DUF1642 domain-containing protein n=1 Tax=Streptococcus suis TaxID=1307 RepID=UPI00209BBB78|nr:DUF1642 domain-containing protein [Streptococcus suis]MCO8204465.1 DUF1642 domain-containing protein [Streptococcus suis]HEM3454678.1 DUF1642 domain-containing protein [Streptococcus suis]
MKQHDFYEANGCTEFIPVTINETYTDGIDVTVRSTTHPFRITVKQVYQFLKPHEPQKVIIPRFVADWINYCKREGKVLQTALNNTPDDVHEWLHDGLGDRSFSIFARAWLDGYEVEKEQLYTVEIPDPNSYCDYRYLSRNDNGICLDASNDTKWKQKKRNQLTEAEIKQDFKWAWQFAKEVE